MSVFVHEFFCSGGFDRDLADTSLAREGLAMLRAVIEDFARCTGDRVHTTLDRRLLEQATLLRFEQFADVDWISTPARERDAFQRRTAESDATFVIAPESGGELLRRRQLVDACGGRFLGHSADAIALCGDKFHFFQHLARTGLPTIPTSPADVFANKSPFPFPIVVKPRDGAGSQDTFLIANSIEWDDLRNTLGSTLGEHTHRTIAQPFIEGKSLSVAALVDGVSSRVEVFPVGEQHLSDDGRFAYQGGRIPAACALPSEIPELIATTCRAIPGLCGYIGFDLILVQGSSRVVLVEANPRLTTAYLGYRNLAQENLAARLLDPGDCADPIAWRPGEIVFQADGDHSAVVTVT